VEGESEMTAQGHCMIKGDNGSFSVYRDRERADGEKGGGRGVKKENARRRRRWHMALTASCPSRRSSSRQEAPPERTRTGGTPEVQNSPRNSPEEKETQQDSHQGFGMLE